MKKVQEVTESKIENYKPQIHIYQILTNLENAQDITIFVQVICNEIDAGIITSIFASCPILIQRCVDLIKNTGYAHFLFYPLSLYADHA